MKILFIGGTGVISTACSNLCIEKGFDLQLLNRGLSFRKVNPGVKFINADIRDADSVRAALANEKFDVVVDWIAYNKDHVKSDHELFRGKTDQYIFISSASVYQKPPLKLPITEDTPLNNPFWSYSQKKIEAENYLMKVFNEEKFPVTICRPSHTYDKTRIALYGGYTALHRIKTGKKVILHEDGNTIWTLTSAKDFAKGFTGLLGNSKTIGEAYHITSDMTLTWNNIGEVIADAAGLELKIAYLPSEFIAGYDSEWGCNLLGDKGYSTVFDNSKIKTIVPEFEATIPYPEGAKEIMEWFSNKVNQVVDEDLNSLMDKMIEDYRLTGI